MKISDNTLKSIKDAVELGVDEVSVNGLPFYIVKGKLMDKDKGGNPIKINFIELIYNGKLLYRIDSKGKVVFFKKVTENKNQTKLIKSLVAAMGLVDFAIYAKEKAIIYRAYLAV